MESFRYASLPEDIEDNTIRIAEIKPGQRDDLISCNIKHVRLADQPRYEALSYCWGDPALNKSINCMGKPLAITTNLYLALRQLQSPSETRILWLDAICINQQDIDERNQQVRLMRQIYENAERVIIWLGEEADNSHHGMRLVPKLAEANKKRDALGDTRVITELQRSGLRGVYGLPDRYDDAWRGFFAILQRPWFGRGWVIQEVAVASSIEMFCGREIVSLDDFTLALVFSNSIWLAQKYLSNNYGRLMTMVLTRQAFKSGARLSLLSLLLRYRMALTTDPRDKVFALCGLAGDVGADGLHIRPNYRLPAHEVHHDLAVRMLIKSQNLDILSVQNEAESSTYPSWVPDVSQPIMTGSLVGLGYTHLQTCPYKASRDSKAAPKFSGDSRLIALYGLVFDIITQTGETQPLLMGDDDAVTPIKDLREGFEEPRRYINWRSIAGLLTTKKYVTGEDLEDAYWQTLIAGYNPGKGRLADKEQIKAHYVAWAQHSFKHAYLRRLPSPLFEYALAGTIVIALCWHIFRFLIWLPSVSAPHNFQAMMGNTLSRRLVKTDRGYIGLAGDAVRAGDLILICKGGKIPLVARKADKGRLKLLGDCYVHGIMNGEAFDEQKCKPLWFC